MEINTSTTKAFAYTVKALGTDKDPNYDLFFNKLDRFNIQVEFKVSERDSKGKLHYHGILYIDKGFFRRRLTTRGYHIKLDEIYDREGWLRYIHKEVNIERLFNLKSTLDELIYEVTNNEAEMEQYII